MLDDSNTYADLWGYAAYRSKDRQQALAALGYRSHIHTKVQANQPLSERKKVAYRRRSKIRARVDHVFASQVAMGGQLVRTIIGLARTRGKITLNNMVYNLKRWTYLQEASA